MNIIDLMFDECGFDSLKDAAKHLLPPVIGVPLLYIAVLHLLAAI
jgi:hypothetical protein